MRDHDDSLDLLVDGLQPKGEEDAGSRMASSMQIRMLGLCLLVFIVLLIYLLILLWPPGFTSSTAGSDKQILSSFFGKKVEVTIDATLIMLVMLAGGIGAFVHTATSFGDFVGNQKLTHNWIWWYVLKPFIGMALATLMYMAFRGGFLTVGDEAGKINLYATVALAGMVGMFSKQATDKLSEVFNTLFKSSKGEGDDSRKDSLNAPASARVALHESELDACGREITDFTPDEELPPATGGIAS